MKTKSQHTFHIPVMGTAFTIDTPLKVARFGISSVVSIGDDLLCEQMRLYYAKKHNKPCTPIEKTDEDYRARRITAYLDLIHDVLAEQISHMKTLSFDGENDLVKYFNLLPDTSPSKQKFMTMLQTTDTDVRITLQQELKEEVVPGTIDVNIMTKLDRQNYGKDGQLLPDAFSDGCAALRGYATSKLHSNIIFSAGFNRRLYAYIEEFDDFFPDQAGYIKKKVVVKVSDYRSSYTQGKFLAKKGIWISEHRIESGLNCGGHAFASDGLLLGPILDEFKLKKPDLIHSLTKICNESLSKKSKHIFDSAPETKITVQGGIGTAKEDKFLQNHYKVSGTGWATPFLLVPEVTTIDNSTRERLAASKQEDLFLSGNSPLGVPFNTLRDTDSDIQRQERVDAKKPGSPCPKGHLVSNTEFSKKPVCTASIFYQKRKTKNLEDTITNPQLLKEKLQELWQKTCLCEDLAAGALILNNISSKFSLKTAVCPGPNLAYFSKIATLSEMISHIYGRINLLNTTYRPNMFINELKMYVKFLSDKLKAIKDPTKQDLKYINTFRVNLMSGMEYYTELIPKLVEETIKYRENMKNELQETKQDLENLIDKYKDLFIQNHATA